MVQVMKALRDIFRAPSEQEIIMAWSRGLEESEDRGMERQAQMLATINASDDTQYDSIDEYLNATDHDYAQSALIMLNQKRMDLQRERGNETGSQRFFRKVNEFFTGYSEEEVLDRSIELTRTIWREEHHDSKLGLNHE